MKDNKPEKKTKLDKACELAEELRKNHVTGLSAPTVYDSKDRYHAGCGGTYLEFRTSLSYFNELKKKIEGLKHAEIVSRFKYDDDYPRKITKTGKIKNFHWVVNIRVKKFV